MRTLEIFSWSSAFGTFGRPGWITSTNYIHTQQQTTHPAVNTPNRIEALRSLLTAACHHRPSFLPPPHHIVATWSRPCVPQPYSSNWWMHPDAYNNDNCRRKERRRTLFSPTCRGAPAIVMRRALAYHLATRQEGVTQELAGAHGNWNLISHSFCLFCCENEWRSLWRSGMNRPTQCAMALAEPTNLPIRPQHH